MVFYGNSKSLDEDDNEMVSERDNDGEYRKQEDKLQQFVPRQPSSQYQHVRWSSSGGNSEARPYFRPSSAPARRPNAVSIASHAQDNDKKHMSLQLGSSTSLAYLRIAAKKKRIRDREFARELLREENDLKKHLSAKIEQANKIMTAAGSSKSFTSAPDRDGTQMIKVVDSATSDRVISVNLFLREFEQLALGKRMEHLTLSNSSTVPQKVKDVVSRTKQSRGSLASHSSARSPSVSYQPQKLELDQDDQKTPKAKIKVADRSQVQEELRKVLEGTVELTKVLQEQLHQLQLKGWNATPQRDAY